MKQCHYLWGAIGLIVVYLIYDRYSAPTPTTKSA